MTENHNEAKRRPRVLRVALLAACICLVLAGTVLAVSALTDSGDYTPEAGFITVSTSTGPVEVQSFQISFDEPLRMATEDISENVFSLSGVEHLIMNDPEEAASFLGIDILCNPMLESPRYLENASWNQGDFAPLKPACYVAARTDDNGNIRYFCVDAKYEREEWDNVTLNYYAVVFTEYADDTSIGCSYSPSSRHAPELEIYTSPTGLQASIIHTKVCAQDTYEAYFAYGGVVYVLSAFPQINNNPNTLEILKQVLDAFEFEQ